MNSTVTEVEILDLIGLKAVVVESSDPTLKGLTGLVVDETKNMVRIISLKKIKSLPKRVVRLRLSYKDTHILIDGRKIVGRPEDREKRIVTES